MKEKKFIFGQFNMFNVVLTVALTLSATVNLYKPTASLADNVPVKELQT